VIECRVADASTSTFTNSARVKDGRGVDLISNPLPFKRLWYGDANAVANTIGTWNTTAAYMML
jgi:peroxiredoxin